MVTFLIKYRSRGGSSSGGGIPPRLELATSRSTARTALHASLHLFTARSSLGARCLAGPPGSSSSSETGPDDPSFSALYERCPVPDRVSRGAADGLTGRVPTVTCAAGSLPARGREMLGSRMCARPESN